MNGVHPAINDVIVMMNKSRNEVVIVFSAPAATHAAALGYDQSTILDGQVSCAMDSNADEATRWNIV
jgi:hypothetical protein